MGQHAYNNTFDMSVQANYQALMGTFYHSAIIADGWAKTADTGQTDPTSAALPAQNANTVFEIFKSPTIAGLADIFVKLSYQRSGTNSPQFAVQCGLGTDGAGNLTGTTSTIRTAITPGTAGNPLHAYFSGGTFWFTLSLDIVNTNGNGCTIAIDRSLDATEAPTNEFFTQVTYTNGSGPFQETKMITGVIHPGIQSGIRGPVISTASWIMGSNALVPLMHPITINGFAIPSSIVALWTSQNITDFALDTVTTINVFGTNHNYIVTGIPNTGNGNSRPMLRYD